MTASKRIRPPLTPHQQHLADELREKIKTLHRAHYHASARALRRKLRALLGGYELE